MVCVWLRGFGPGVAEVISCAAVLHVMQVFKDGAVPTLENVFSGYCGAILAYGQTGTGKTHTMQGYDKDPNGPGRGIIPRCADYIFGRINKTPDTDYRVTISFVQIYLDKLQDLFKPDAPEISINPETERVELPGIVQYEVFQLSLMLCTRSHPFAPQNCVLRT